MTTPSEVVEAAADVLAGSRLERARAGMTALTLFGQLSAQDKRDLAVLIAQRAAPQLVPRIEAEAGLDLTAEQSRAVLDMVRRLDGDDLAEIQAALGSAEGRREAAAAVGTAAATATGVDDVVASGTREQVVHAPVDDETSERDRARIRVLEEHVDHLTEQVADARHDTSEAESRARTAEGELQTATALADEAQHRAEELSRALDEARRAMRRADERARAADAAALRASRRDIGADSHGAVGRGPGRGGRPGPPADDTSGVDGLARRMTTTSTSGALRLLAGAAPSLAGRTPAERRRLVTTLPDGWARRKAVQRLVEAGVVTAPEAPGLLATLASVGNQVFAAGTMLAAGLVDLDDLAGDLDPSAMARLARRAPTA